MDAARVASLERSFVTPEQMRRLHTTQTEDAPIVSPWEHNQTPVTWSTQMHEPMTPSTDRSSIVYAANGKFDLLLASYLRVHTPVVRVKPEYVGLIEVAWTHNLGHNIVHSAVLNIDKNTFTPDDSINSDIRFNQRLKGQSGHRESQAQYCGNVAMLEEFSSALPEFPLHVLQNWFYGVSPNDALEIFYGQNRPNLVTHAYVFRPFHELLRARRIVGEKHYEDILGTEVMKYVEPFTSTTPDLVGVYAKLDPKWVAGKLSGSKSVSHDFRDLVTFDKTSGDGTGKPQGKSQAAKITTNEPCTVVYWMALNMNARANNYYSNYTTCAEDIRRGFDPCISNSWYYKKDGLYRFKDEPGERFSVVNQWLYCDTAAMDRGYHLEALCAEVASSGPQSGLILADRDVIFTVVPDAPDMWHTRGAAKVVDYEASAVATPLKAGVTNYQLIVRVEQLRTYTITKEDGIWHFRLLNNSFKA